MRAREFLMWEADLCHSAGNPRPGITSDEGCLCFLETPFEHCEALMLYPSPTSMSKIPTFPSFFIVLGLTHFLCSKKCPQPNRHDQKLNTDERRTQCDPRQVSGATCPQVTAIPVHNPSTWSKTCPSRIDVQEKTTFSFSSRRGYLLGARRPAWTSTQMPTGLIPIRTM